MSIFKSWIACLLLTVTAIWVTPAFACEFCELHAPYIAVHQMTDAQAPPVIPAKAAAANAAQLMNYEQINGVTKRSGVKLGAAQVDALIVGAERAQKSWRHSGIHTL